MANRTMEVRLLTASYVYMYSSYTIVRILLHKWNNRDALFVYVWAYIYCGPIHTRG